jgi:N-acetylneuraminic acid mutarotase/fibronectin type 3 domain-containing protein
MRKKLVKLITWVLAILILVCTMSTSAFAFDFSSPITKASMPTTVYAFASATVGGKIYTFGGNSAAQISPGNGYLGVTTVQMYNPSTDTWTTKANMPTARRYCAAAAVDGIIYVIGGSYKTASTTTTALAINEAYNPATDSWTTKASLPVALHGVTASVANGKIYVIGGATVSNGTGTRVNTVYMYDPSSNTWTQKASMSVARETTSVVADGMIYAISGFNGTSPSLNVLSSVEMYNPSTNTWTTKASMGTARFGEECFAADGKIYAIGGMISSSYIATSSIEVYDIATNTWSTLSDNLNFARGLMGSSVIGNSVFIFGGENNANANLYNTVEQYVFTSDAPTLTATASDGEVTLSWGAINYAAGYNVYRATTSGGIYTRIASNITNTTYTDASLINGTTYYYTVTDIGSYNTESTESEYSNVVSSTPILSVPTTPTSLSAISGNGKVDLSWAASSGSAITYNIKRATTSGGIYATIATSSGITYTDTGVSNGTTYYYVVSALNTSGESIDSSEVSSTPQASAVTGSALLMIKMVDGIEKEYELSMIEVEAFISWYDIKATGSGKAYYIFNKAYNKGPFESRKDYIVFDKIQNFEVMQY